MKIFFITLGLFFSSTLFCALPPLYQSANEIKAIVSSKQLGTVLKSGELIIDIQRNDEGYELITNRSKVQIQVINKPSNGKAGPVQFELKFGVPTPL